MSHIPQRKEKDCLNCGATVQGRFCQDCGQENVVPHETFWHMVRHFLYDITHFDSNFFGSIHHLIFKPGFLSREYIKGRRASYLHPIKMYVFTSAIFFLLFFSFFMPKDPVKTDLNIPLRKEQRAEYIGKVNEKLKKEPGNDSLKQALAWLQDTSRTITKKNALEFELEENNLFVFTERDYHSVREYDSVQQLLPPSERDGWFTRRLVKKQIDINERYREDPEGALNKVTENLFHRIPYMLFVSLPLFALILKLVYLRRKQFYFADHGVFTIHLYVFTFLVLLVIFIFDKLSDRTNWNIWGILTFLLVLLLFFYLYKGMRNFYGQKRGKTILKFLIVSLVSIIMMLLLFVFFAFFSAITL
ncbi:MAG: DUF3667 domain-containing protein [Chitinophagaceae bacterium]